MRTKGNKVPKNLSTGEGGKSSFTKRGTDPGEGPDRKKGKIQQKKSHPAKASLESRRSLERGEKQI